MYSIISSLIVLFLATFIFSFFQIYRNINNESFKSRDSYSWIIILITFTAWLILTTLYADLSENKKLRFVESYSFSTEGKESITIGRGEGEDKTYLSNRLAVENHLLIHLNKNQNSKNIGTLELLTDKRKAIVNNQLLQNLPESESAIREKLALSSKIKMKPTIHKIAINNGDFIRIGYSNYEIYKEKNSIVLKNVSLSMLSPLSLFYLYTTTTYPDTVVGEKHGVKSFSLFWLWGVNSMILFIFTFGLIYVVHMLTQQAKRAKEWAIIHPILYFSIFLAFLFSASYINFTIMYFYQFNVYEKGSLFTIMSVFFLVILFMFIVFLLLKTKNIVRNSFIAMMMVIGTLLLFVLSYADKIYSSSLLFGVLPKSTLVFVGEQTFIFAIFLLFAIFVAKGEKSLFVRTDRNLINNKIYNHIAKGTIILLFIIIVLFFGGLIREGQGMVFIESGKLFLFLLATLVFHHTFSTHKRQYLIGFGLLFTLLLFSILALKDMGSMLQIVLALSIIVIFFKDDFHIQKRWVVIGAILIAVFMTVFYHFELKDNIRFSMWIEPFVQSNTPSTQFYMYRYEQIARGLYLIHSSSLISSDFINNSFLPLSAIHTDFIFAFYSNIFGWFGVMVLITALVLVLLSFNKAMQLYSQKSKEINSTFKFIYGINGVFIAYMLSYFIINIASVLQIIPLTDVPLPFLTYSKGILILFLMLYLFVVSFNLKYLQHEKGGK